MKVPQASDEFTYELVSAFGLGDVSQPMTPVIYDYMGRRWSVTTDQGRFVAGPVFDWITEAQAELAVTLMEQARRTGVSAPEPVRAPDASLVKKVGGESWRVDRWMDYGPAPMPPVRSTVAGGVGEILATLHALAIPGEGPVNPFLTHRRPSLGADWELGSVLWHWAMQPRTHPPAAKALMDGYSRVSGSRPVLDLDTFSVAVTGWLNWAYNQFCESANPEDPDAEAFANREIRDLIEHPLTVANFEQILGELSN